MESDRLHTIGGSIAKEPTVFIFENSKNVVNKYSLYFNTLNQQKSLQSHIKFWYANCGLSINPLKTKKYKIPAVFLPSIAGAPLVLSDRVKYQ